jgi:7-dehydrocholesterol reductase
MEAAAILLFGCVAILLNYMVDLQKEKFKAGGGQCHIWGRPAKFLAVEYKNHDGKVRKSRLLLSGFWGLARHMNYVFEIMLAFSWSLPAIHYGISPFFYVIFLIILLVHRTFRDEEKCSNKYGKGWETYCEKVPYRLIPGIF